MSQFLVPNNYYTLYCKEVVQSGEGPAPSGASFISVTGSSAGAALPPSSGVVKVVFGNASTPGADSQGSPANWTWDAANSQLNIIKGGLFLITFNYYIQATGTNGQIAIADSAEPTDFYPMATPANTTAFNGILSFSRITRLTDASTFYFVVTNRSAIGQVTLNSCNFSLTQLGA
jgi:hypothetical protein